MTEEQAKTKWCPRVPRDLNGVYEHSLAQACIGSACMAWREVVVEQPVLKDGTSPKPGRAYLAADVVKRNRHIIGGFCGLAGTP